MTHYIGEVLVYDTFLVVFINWHFGAGVVSRNKFSVGVVYAEMHAHKPLYIPLSADVWVAVVGLYVELIDEQEVINGADF